MQTFKSLGDAVEQTLTSLAKHKTATLHIVANAANPEMGYLELALSEEQERLSVIVDRSDDELAYSGHVLITAEQFIHEIELLHGSVSAGRVSELMEAGIVPIERFMKFNIEGNPNLMATSSTRICLVFRSLDWDALSEYYGTYLNPTRH